MSRSTQLEEFFGRFQTVALPAGTFVFRAGDPCENFYLVQSGSIRVDLINSQGKSILLYRIGADETCILTTSCLMSEENYSAEAVTENDVKAAVIPKADFLRHLNSSARFREMVFHTFSVRLASMMAKIDEISFSSLGSRIGQRLLELSQGDSAITITHEQLAHDIGSAREVVSRKLMEMENAGLVARSRGEIKILSTEGIRQIIHQGD